MSTSELDEFLAAEPLCRVATIGSTGFPHVSPLWFAWDGSSLWLSSIVKSQRWTNLSRDPRVNVIVDAGHDYGELRGVQLTGTVSVVGEVPRTGEPCPELDEVERIYARKYTSRDELAHDGRHAWMRLTPHKIVSWDFRKLGG